MTPYLSLLLGCLAILILAVQWVRLLDRVRVLEAMVERPEGEREVGKVRTLRRVK